MTNAANHNINRASGVSRKIARSKIEGFFVPAGYTTFLFALGIMALARLGQTDILYVDSIRGFLTMAAALFAYREIKN